MVFPRHRFMHSREEKEEERSLERWRVKVDCFCNRGHMTSGTPPGNRIALPSVPSLTNHNDRQHNTHLRHTQSCYPHQQKPLSLEQHSSGTGTLSQKQPSRPRPLESLANTRLRPFELISDSCFPRVRVVLHTKIRVCAVL